MTKKTKFRCRLTSQSEVKLSGQSYIIRKIGKK